MIWAGFPVTRSASGPLSFFEMAPFTFSSWVTFVIEKVSGSPSASVAPARVTTMNLCRGGHSFVFDGFTSAQLGAVFSGSAAVTVIVTVAVSSARPSPIV